MDKRKLSYYISTGIFVIMTLGAVFMYFFNTEMVGNALIALGYPTYLIYPLGVAKFCGVVAILSRKNKFLEEMAYSGFFYVLILATLSHIMVADGQFLAPLVELVAVIISYNTRKYR